MDNSAKSHIKDLTHWNLLIQLPDDLILIDTNGSVIDQSVKSVSNDNIIHNLNNQAPIIVGKNIKLNHFNFIVEDSLISENDYKIYRLKQISDLLIHSEDLKLFMQSENFIKVQWDLSNGNNSFHTNESSLFGYGINEINKTNNFLLSILHPESKDQIPKIIKDFENNLCEKTELEFTVKSKSDNRYWLKGFFVYKNGIINCFLKDVTEQKLIKEALSKSELEKSQILDSMIDGAALIGPDLKIKYANKKFKEDYSNYDENQETQFCYKVIHNMNNQCITCSVDKVIKNKKFHRTVRSSKNGPSILTITYPVVDKQNNVTGAVLTLRDISESKNTEKALKKEATINKVIAEISTEILLPKLPEEKIAQRILSVAMSLTKSSTGYVSSKNEDSNELEWIAYENYSLKTPANINEVYLENTKNNGLSQFLKNRDKSFISNKLQDFIDKNKLIKSDITKANCLMVPALFNDELIGQIFVAGSERPFSDNDEKVLKQLSSVYALSIYRKKIEKELINAKDTAEESSKLKSAFLANMSHEIRTPMNAISGFAELLQNTQPKAETQEQYLNIIYKSSNQLLNIINNVLDISKLEVGQVKLNEREFNINQIVLDTVQSVTPDILIDKQVKIRANTSLNDDQATILTDGPRLQQVLTNLLSNALKFTEDGTIEVGYTLNNDLLKFTVKDTGVGIPQQFHHIIFERFGQAEEGHIRNYEGAGLGLSICKGLVDLMGGDIGFESEINVGSTFFFSIPYKAVLVKNNSKTTNNSNKEYNWKNKKILLVEDESFSQNFMETILLPQGVKIVYAEDGFDALNQVRLNPDIDLVLMDVRLPRLDGIEATKKIRLLGFTKPIIAQTANALAEDRKECLEAGCNDFVSKPINRIELLQKIDSFIN